MLHACSIVSFVIFVALVRLTICAFKLAEYLSKQQPVKADLRPFCGCLDNVNTGGNNQKKKLAGPLGPVDMIVEINDIEYRAYLLG